MNMRANQDCYLTADCRRGGRHCRFGAMVFRGLMKGRPSRAPLIWGEAPFFVGDMNLDLYTAWKRYAYVNRGGDPSSGFLAFLTFAPICKELHVYGFSGHGSLDHHKTTAPGREHGFIGAVAS